MCLARGVSRRQAEQSTGSGGREELLDVRRNKRIGSDGCSGGCQDSDSPALASNLFVAVV